MAPRPIEEVIQRCEFVSQALVLGDKRPFISALVTLDEESLRPWLEAKGLDRDMPLEEAAENAVVRAEVQKYVDQANEGVSRAESVRKFIILPEEFTQENGLMTALDEGHPSEGHQALRHAAQHADVHQAQVVDQRRTNARMPPESIRRHSYIRIRGARAAWGRTASPWPP